MSNLSFFSLILFVFLLPSFSQDFSSCDIEHPFRLLTRMSGKALFAAGSSLVLDFIDSVAQTSQTDEWYFCQESGQNYTRNAISGTYLSFNAATQWFETSNTGSTQIFYDTWMSVPGYTLVTFQGSDGECMMAYENDMLRVSPFDTSNLWAQWNLQPLDSLSFQLKDDCETAFLIQNKGSGRYVSFGNAYPYDGNIIPHYGNKNFLVYDQCSYQIYTQESKLWVLCNGNLRTKYQLPLSDPNAQYYYIANDAIRIYTGFEKVMSASDVATNRPAHVNDYSNAGNIQIKLDVFNYNREVPQMESWYFYYDLNSGSCGGTSFTNTFNEANADYYSWNFIPPKST